MVKKQLFQKVGVTGLYIGLQEELSWDTTDITYLLKQLLDCGRSRGGGRGCEAGRGVATLSSAVPSVSQGIPPPSLKPHRIDVKNVTSRQLEVRQHGFIPPYAIIAVGIRQGVLGQYIYNV